MRPLGMAKVNWPGLSWAEFVFMIVRALSCGATKGQWLWADPSHQRLINWSI
jgi:hypothetical protein